MEWLGKRLGNVAVPIVLTVGFLGVPAVHAVDCDRGPVLPPTPTGENLEFEAQAWGGYCEGLADWAITHDQNGLRLAYDGGDPYSAVHFYRQLSLDSSDRSYRLELEFDLPETSLNNVGEPSLVQAVEFVASAWANGERYEWAVQWNNVGPNAPEWRLWDPAQGWVSTGIDAPLSAGWHHLELDGRIVGSGARLQSLTVDGTEVRLNKTVPTVAAPEVDDIVAAAVQLDGNAAGEAYEVTVRKLSLHRK